MQPFGEVIEKTRRKLRLSKTRLGAKADLSAATITRVEKSERSVTLETLDKAADQLGYLVVIKLIPKPAEAAAANNP